MDDEETLETFRRLAAPLRRRYPPLYASPIVSVQPLGGPAGLIYYMRWKRENSEDVNWKKEGF